MTTVKVDAAGHWMRADAAASYLRMLAAGMPAGGIDVFGRTLAQQADLYARARERGVTTAPPTPNAPHVRGVAFDSHTTTGGRYTPSPAHVWLTEGGNGAKRVAGESIRANGYGFYRTVPGERWHFAYDPTRDKHMPGAATYPATIRKGATGATVTRLQTALRAADYRGDLLNRVRLVVDGSFGPATTRAVKRWQKAHGLPADGIVGAKTWASLGITN